MVVLDGRRCGGGGRNHLGRGGKARPVVPRRVHMSLRRWQAIVLAAAIVIVPILSCSQRSLVLVTVSAPQGVTYAGDVTLVIKANDEETTTFDQAVFTAGVYKAGVYLPSNMSGNVMISAEVDQANCKVATGSATALGVSAGATVSTTVDLSAITGPCTAVDGGAGSSGTGGGTGSGGATTGAGGVVGTG